jgi:hypothetical protein
VSKQLKRWRGDMQVSGACDVCCVTGAVHCISAAKRATTLDDYESDVTAAVPLTCSAVKDSV